MNEVEHDRELSSALADMTGAILRGDMGKPNAERLAELVASELVRRDDIELEALRNRRTRWIGSEIMTYLVGGLAGGCRRGPR